MTFPLQVIEEIKRTVALHAKHPFIIGYKFSPEEAETPGITMAETLKFVDVFAEQGIDYLHVSQHSFWSLVQRGVEDTRARIEIIKELVGDRVPLIGVGEIRTLEDAIKALGTGVELLAIAKAILIDPDWIEKIQAGREEDIQTTLLRHDQVKLVLPDPLWNRIPMFIPFKD
jgi:2,4-dienoyl-CoA reductase-like NADH-dependent reductase (Old Yellow Enzyme family)